MNLYLDVITPVSVRAHYDSQREYWFDQFTLKMKGTDANGNPVDLTLSVQHDMLGGLAPLFERGKKS